MYGKRISLTALAASALLFLSPGVRAHDDPEPNCDDADVENLETTIQCNGGTWNLAGSYDVEVEDPSETQYDLVLTLRDCNKIPSGDCGALTTFTVPLNSPIEPDADDNDEIEFEGTFSQCLGGDLTINCDRLRVYAEVVKRCDRVVLDMEEDKVRALDEGTCSEPQVAIASPCDPCGARVVSHTSPCGDPCGTRAVSHTSPCGDPCGSARATTVRYQDSGYRRTYVDDADVKEVEIERDGDKIEIDYDD
jgi:hypothetical protein